MITYLSNRIVRGIENYSFSFTAKFTSHFLLVQSKVCTGSDNVTCLENKCLACLFGLHADRKQEKYHFAWDTMKPELTFLLLFQICSN